MNKVIIINIIVAITVILSTSAIFADTTNYKNNTQSIDTTISKSIVRYETVSIQNGDCLSVIAEKHNTSNMSTSDFIDYIKTFNNLKSDTIYFGNSILIPIFE